MVKLNYSIEILFLRSPFKILLCEFFSDKIEEYYLVK